MIHPDISNNIFKEEYFIYDPVNVIDSIKSETGTLVNRPPISQIYGGPGLGPEGRSFIELARKRGIIFMYELKSGQAVKNNEDITF